jgi:hypothetical protein
MMIVLCRVSEAWNSFPSSRANLVWHLEAPIRVLSYRENVKYNRTSTSSCRVLVKLLIMVVS